MYICGHPGQGKTVVLDQVLNDYFSKDLIFKYNAMTFSSLTNFIQTLISDIESKAQEMTKTRKKKGKKTDFDKLTLPEMTEIVCSLFTSLKSNRKTQMFLIIDEIDSFSKNNDSNSRFRSFLETLGKLEFL